MQLPHSLQITIISAPHQRQAKLKPDQSDLRRLQNTHSISLRNDVTGKWEILCRHVSKNADFPSTAPNGFITTVYLNSPIKMSAASKKFHLVGQ
jgi:hypothetical protein